jgi:sugar phosphate isomerase/epimerase
LDGVQVNMGSLANKMWLRQPEVQKAYLDAARQNGVQIGGLAMCELNNNPLKSDGRAVVWLVDAVDVAKALGAKIILVAQFYKGDLKDDAEGVKRTIEVLKEVAPRAEKVGVILGIENYLSGEENRRIVESVASPAVQVYYDVGNSTDKGYDIYAEMRQLKNLICEFHFKDAGHLLGKGRVDFTKVRQIIEEIGYSGWLQIEGAAPNGLIKDYQANLAYLRSLFPKA